MTGGRHDGGTVTGKSSIGSTNLAEKKVKSHSPGKLQWEILQKQWKRPGPKGKAQAHSKELGAWSRNTTKEPAAHLDSQVGSDCTGPCHTTAGAAGRRI